MGCQRSTRLWALPAADSDETADLETGCALVGTDAKRRLSRRQLLAGGLVGLGAVGVAGITRAVGSPLGGFSIAALATEPAVRLGNTASAPTSTTVPLRDGEILFPIVSDEGDYVYVTHSFGDPRGCCRTHEAVDILADEGLPLRAVAHGVLTKRYVDRGLTSGSGHGWTLEDPSSGVVYKYFHMGAHVDGLNVGDEVEQGEIIGYVGETGTTGAGSPVDNFHCHFEYRPGNIARDPFHLLQRPPHVIFERT